MIVLKSTAELHLVFNKLIKTLSVPVEWNGNFVISGNFLILPGKERSVIFNYDTRRVTTNLSDDKLSRKVPEPIKEGSGLINIFNLVLYAFGKWGALKGITVEKDYKKINTLVGAVFGAYGVSADYTEQHCFWYKDGTRITYEDVIQLAIESEHRQPESEEDIEEETGLWHSTTWKLDNQSFIFEKLPMAQRRKGRIGHNFYKVGYACPHCGEKLYMASFSGREKPVIDTVEGRVQLARAFFCPSCVIFYTPLPEAGLEDEEVYYLDFDGDKTAGNDYMEMLGRLGTREVNGDFNKYVDRVNDEGRTTTRQSLNGIDKGISDERRSLNGIDKGIKDDRRSLNGIDKGIKDDRRSLNGIDKGIKYDRRSLNGIDKGIKDDRRSLNGIDKGIKDDRRSLNGIDKGISDDRRSLNGIDKGIKDDRRSLNGIDKGIKDDRRSLNGIDKGISDDRRSLNGIDKGISDDRRSLNGIDKGIKDDRRSLNGIDKGIKDDRRSLNGIDKGISDDRSDLNGIDKGISDDRRSLNGVRKFDDENEQISDKVSGNPDKEDVFDIVHEKAAVMADIDGTGELHTYRKDTSHVRCKDAIKSSRRKLRIRRLAVLFKSFSIVKWFRRKGYGKASKENSDKELYRNAERISAPGAVTASDGKAGYTMREEAESAPAQRRKLDELLEKTGNATRKDIVDLLDKVKAGHFDKTVQMEYAGKLQEDIAALDRRRIDEACKGYLDYNGEELEKLYSMIEEEEFLPEIKAAALDSVAGRLWKIRNEEAELLVKRIKKSLCENGVSENHALYFYPAMEILEGRADTHVKDHLECAVDSYAPGLGKYEYPVIMEDTTGKQNGKRGMFITPDAIYYGNFYTYGHIMAENIERIGSYTGFMGRYVIVYLDDGSKIRLSSVIAKDELEAYAMTLNDFVIYLKQKPFSRKEKYLAKESHDVICCFRCGYVYKNMKECPKCGYKFNI